MRNYPWNRETGKVDKGQAMRYIILTILSFLVVFLALQDCNDFYWIIPILIVAIVALIKAEQPIKDINAIITRDLRHMAHKKDKIRSRRQIK